MVDIGFRYIQLITSGLIWNFDLCDKIKESDGVVYVTDKGILQGTVPCLEDVEVRFPWKVWDVDSGIWRVCFMFCPMFWGKFPASRKVQKIFMISRWCAVVVTRFQLRLRFECLLHFQGMFTFPTVCASGAVNIANLRRTTYQNQGFV